MEFNPDGSLKLPSSAIKYKQDNIDRMRSSKCILIRKELVNFTAPKKCVLHMRLSEKIVNSIFVNNIHKYFKDNAETPTKITRINDKEFDIEIGTNFRRCTECTTLIGRYREFLDGNLILEKGNCTFESFRKNFSYEDYFE